MVSCVEQLQQRFYEAGVPFEVVEHPTAMTTQEAAAATGVSGYSMAKAVVVMVEDEPRLCVLPAASTVDLDALATSLNALDVRLAREDEFEPLFLGCDAGAIPPIALTPGLPVHIDRNLLENDTVVFEAGSGTDAIRMRTDDYLLVAQGQLMEFAELPHVQERQRRPGAGFEWRTWGKRAAAGLGTALALVVGPRVVGRILPNRTSRSFAAGATAGAAAAMLADPRQGARRRAILRDKSMRYVRRSAGWVARKARYSRGRMQGVQYTVRQALPGAGGESQRSEDGAKPTQSREAPTPTG